MVRWFVFLLAMLLPAMAAAQIESVSDYSKDYGTDYPYPAPYPTASSNQLISQVIFDGEGEAAVAANLSLVAQTETIEAVTLTIPGDSVRLRRALQEYAVETEEEYCEIEGPYDEAQQDYPCLKLGTRTVYKTKVDQLEPETRQTASGLELTLPLVKAIAPQESTSLVFAYKAAGYLKDPAGGIDKFTFPTPLVPYDLDSVSVRVDVTSDLVLKGGKAVTDYKASLAEGVATTALTSVPAGFSPRFQDAVYESQAFVKTTHALDPNESFEVNGTYARTWAQLYWIQIVLAIGIFVAFAVMILWGERRLARTQAK